MSGYVSTRGFRLAASTWRPLGAKLDRVAGAVFILPAVVVILGFSIFPLLASLYVSVSRLSFNEGGVDLKFVGLDNYAKLIVGIDRVHLLGLAGPATPLSIAVLLAGYGLLAFALYRYVRSGDRTAVGMFGRVFVAVVAGGLLWLLVTTIMTSGRPGTLVVTMVYVGVDVTVQYLLALGLALLVVQHLPGRRFFRVVFLLPMMITPVGVAYLFRMLTDTDKGPLYPLWAHFGLTDVSWVTNPWGARLAVMIGDVWQWTPFIFIVLLAAIETLPHELVEAAVVDGANRLQVFWRITFPLILPATSTVVSPFLDSIVTGTISSGRRPASVPSIASSWLRSANLSMSARVSSSSSATSLASWAMCLPLNGFVRPSWIIASSALASPMR